MHEYKDLGFIPTALFKISKNIPKGLNADTVRRWLHGNSSRAKWVYLRYVMEECEKLKSSPQRPVMIDDTLYNQLKMHRARTGIGGVRLLQDRTDIPDGLNGGIVATWLSKAAIKTRADHFDYVLKLWSQR